MISTAAQAPLMSTLPPDPETAAGRSPGAPRADGPRQGQDLPEAEALLALERRARRGGSGLREPDLEGLWLLQRVWSRGQGQPSALAGGLLRGLGASLRIERRAGPAGTAGAAEALQLTNSVRLGALELRFEGPGRLQGRRPLLVFGFDRLQLLAGGRVLLERRLPAADPLRQPFFALIAAGPERRWLAARGRSGGLAVWRLSPPPG